MLFLWRKLFPHVGHLWVFSVVCVLIWSCKVFSRLNSFPQRGQGNRTGFSACFILIWMWRPVWLRYVFSHPTNLHGSQTLEWDCMCFPRYSLHLNFLSQFGQGYRIGLSSCTIFKCRVTWRLFRNDLSHPTNGQDVRSRGIVLWISLTCFRKFPMKVNSRPQISQRTFFWLPWV